MTECPQSQFEIFYKVSSCLSFGSDMTVHGLDKLPISSVGAVVFGFTTQLSYSDLTFASLLLNEPNTLFLLEAPDATLRARTAGDAVVEIPCKTFLNGIRRGINGDYYKVKPSVQNVVKLWTFSVWGHPAGRGGGG